MIVGLSGWMGSGKDTFALMLAYQMKKRTDKYMEDISFADWSFRRELYDGPTTDFEIRRYATKLKQIVSLLTNISLKDLEDPAVKKSVLPPQWNRTTNDAFNFLVLRNNRQMDYAPEDNVDEIASHYGFKKERTVRELLQEIGTDVFREYFGDNIWVNALMQDYHPVYGYDHEIEPQLWPNWFVTDVRFVNEVAAIQSRNGIVIRVNRGKRMSDHPSEASLDNFKQFDAVVDNSGTVEDLLLKASVIVDKFNLITHASYSTKPSVTGQEGSFSI